MHFRPAAPNHNAQRGPIVRSLALAMALVLSIAPVGWGAGGAAAQGIGIDLNRAMTLKALYQGGTAGNPCASATARITTDAAGNLLACVDGAWRDALRVTPAAPTNIAPTNGATDVSLTATLQSSAFAMPSGTDTHAASQWQIASDSGFATLVHSSGDSTSLTSYAIPSSANLGFDTTYYWRVRHKGAATGYGGVVDVHFLQHRRCIR